MLAISNKVFNTIFFPHKLHISSRRSYQQSSYKMISGKLELTSRNPVSLRHTLPCGQSFRWKMISDDTWRGVLDKWLVTMVQKSPELIEYTATPAGNPEALHSRILDYFNMETELGPLYDQWSISSDPSKSKCDINQSFKQVAPLLPGLRLLKQDPYECTFSFICSQNNNIKRISLMIDRLCSRYGSKIAELDGVEYHEFPTLQQLLEASEGDLRDLGFGYRAAYISQAAQQVQEHGGEKWLRSLKDMPREVTRENLMSLKGIGPKVADCICLFSMGHLDVIPVDTHVWQIASRYMPSISKASSPNPKIYKEINDFFQLKFGDKAGWAHTTLFTAELSHFQDIVNGTEPQIKSESPKETKKRKRENVPEKTENNEKPSKKVKQEE